MVALTNTRSRGSAGSRRESHSANPAKVLREAGHQTSDLLTQLGKATRETAGDLKQEVVEVARTAAETVKEEAQRVLDDQREAVGSKVAKAARLARQFGHALRAVRLDDAAKMTDSAAKRVEKLGDYVKEADVSQVLEDAEGMAREHQALFAGGLFIVGLAVARFLKASRESERSGRKGRR